MKLKYEWPNIRNWGSRVAVVATMAIAASALTGVAPAGAIPVPNGATSAKSDSNGALSQPAHQMAELNFLLGTFNCTVAYTNGLRETEITRKILNGEYYQQTAILTIPGIGTIEGVWTLGWDPVNLHFFAQYYDNVGNSGVATSPGWQNGHLMVRGNYVIVSIPGGTSGVGAGLHETGGDDFRILGPNRFTDTNFDIKHGKVVEGSGVSVCHRAQ